MNAQDVVVFLGPTLSRDEARTVLDARYLPPASQGDVYRAARGGARAIGLIDGYFQQVPAVWHKEILWALTQGVHVFGAASMGALRAAELAAFGMRGVGQIFEDYVAGRLSDDDEVALVHSDAESGYQPLCEAMVDMRATLAAARAAGVIGPPLQRRLLDAAKALFYPERRWETVLQAMPITARNRAQVNAFTRWLPTGRVAQKRADALALLHTLAAFRSSQPAPFTARFEFEHTDAWEQVRRRITSVPGAAADAPPDTPDAVAVLAELRLDAPAWQAAQAQARRRALAEALAEARGEQVDDALVPNALATFRLRHDLGAPGSVAPWLARQGLSPQALIDAVRGELAATRQEALLDAHVERALLLQLQLDGRFHALAERARHKAAVLRAIGAENPALAQQGLEEAALWDWYFGLRLRLVGRPTPEAFALDLGVPLAALRREVLRDWVYHEQLAKGA
jgi:hypothetical protein